MHENPAIQSFISIMAVLIVLFVILNSVMLYQRVKMGEERRDKRLTILISLGLILLAGGTLFEMPFNQQAIGLHNAEFYHEILEAAALLAFALAFFFNIQKSALEAIKSGSNSPARKTKSNGRPK